MTGYEKAKFRKSKEWQDFRESFRQENIDALTCEPLKKKFTLHHVDLNPKSYKDLIKEKFLGFNSSFEHRIVHYLYSRYIKDPHIMLRLSKIIEDMAKQNHFKDVKNYK